MKPSLLSPSSNLREKDVVNQSWKIKKERFTAAYVLQGTYLRG